MRNHGSRPVSFTVMPRGEGTLPSAPFGYLHVRSRQTVAPTTASHHVAVEASGRGRLAALCAYVVGVPDPNGGLQYDPLNLLEGDLEIEVDGRIALDGTGTEEYADDVFFLADAPHATVFAQAWGRMNDPLVSPGRASLCRFHVLGTELDFLSSLRARIERGGAGNPEIARRHRSVAYLYLPSPEPR